jgi:hypothetical protein
MRGKRLALGIGMARHGTVAALLLIAAGCGVALAFLLLTSGCSEGVTVVPLLSAAGIPLTQPTTVPLEVVTRSTAVADPLPVHGTDVAYGDVEAALGHAIASATVPWAEKHRKIGKSTDGWQLFVEITNSDANYEDGRVIFSVGVRATLRARAGNVYLAQSQASCRQGGLVKSDKGAPVMYRCMMEVGHDLAGWLDGVDLDAVATSK